ncbi:MAG: TolC family protein, partial [Candidatus Omnitrophica bacterium]|nr:TolC family protein [Candidatus Omnitrophota bacterium]
KLKEVEARFYTALDEVTPDIAFQLSEFWQDSPEKGEQQSGGSSDGASSNLQRRTRPEGKVTFSQSLFKGFKEIAAINASGADKKRQTALLRQAKLLLFLEVSEAFHNLQEARQNLVMLSEMRATLDQRVKDLDERVTLGRSRQSEVETSRADLRLIEADAAEEKRLESVSRQLLEFYTGLESVGALDASFPDLMIAADPSEYTEKATARADVIAAEESLKLAREDVTGARSEFLPSASVDGNYYTRRVGFQSGTDWDLTWKLDVPIFEGTGPLGELKAAEARRRQAELEYQRAGRYARVEIRNAYETLVAWIAQEKALRSAREASNENYRIQNEEYGLSLVNNLQVLDAFRQSQGVSLRWSRAYHEVKRKYWEFRAAQGESVLS